MIFSNKIYKISSGTDLSLFAENSDEMSLTVFNEYAKKKKIIFSPTVKCLNDLNKFGYNKVIKLNGQHCVICFDKCISIIDNIV